MQIVIQNTPFWSHHDLIHNNVGQMMKVTEMKTWSKDAEQVKGEKLEKEPIESSQLGHIDPFQNQ